MAEVACLSVFKPLNPPLKIFIATTTELAVHNIQLKAANAASARAAAQTEPRQKRSFPMKTERAMKPEK